MIPILLITGFLGSGKTTFINWILEKQTDLKISVILNEFGDTKLESHFIKQHAENIMELANGCMCCVAKSDIPRVIKYILEHSPQTEFILIEASGLSDPDPVREALQTPPVNASTYLESTVCVIDAENFETQRSQHSIITSQIADADLILLNKTELAGPQKTERVTSLIQALTPDIRVVILSPDVPVELFLTKSAPSKVLPKHAESHHHAHESYESYWYETTSRFNLDELRETLKRFPPDILRIKGVVKCQLENEPVQLRVQRVGTHVTIELDESADTPQTMTKSGLLFIGKKLDTNAIQELLSTCLTEV